MPTILVIDDDPSVRQLIADTLALEGYDVAVAADGLSGLRAMAGAPPDCVVLDVMMPGLDGHAVLRRIRANVGPDLPVVMLTATTADGQAWRAWTEGASYFLTKPFGADELLRYLASLFPDACDALTA